MGPRSMFMRTVSRVFHLAHLILIVGLPTSPRIKHLGAVVQEVGIAMVPAAPTGAMAVLRTTTALRNRLRCK